MVEESAPKGFGIQDSGVTEFYLEANTSKTCLLYTSLDDKFLPEWAKPKLAELNAQEQTEALSGMNMK